MLYLSFFKPTASLKSRENDQLLFLFYSHFFRFKSQYTHIIPMQKTRSFTGSHSWLLPCFSDNKYLGWICLQGNAIANGNNLIKTRTVCVGNPNHWNHLILKFFYCYKINNCFYEFVYARHHLAKIVSISVAISVMQWESMHLYLALHCSTYEPKEGNQNHTLGFFSRCILPVKFDSCMSVL